MRITFNDIMSHTYQERKLKLSGFRLNLLVAEYWIITLERTHACMCVNVKCTF